MAKESVGSAARLDSLQTALRPIADRTSPPVHLWNPPFCGDIDMRIARDGTWFYAGTPIGRPALVRLFASVLRRDPDGFRLVTPVEKVGITVEDAPFVVVEQRVVSRDGGSGLQFRTNVDEWVTVGPDHPLRFERGDADGLKPYVRVRDDLWALVNRAVFYDLVAVGVVRDHEGVPFFVVVAGPTFFPMAPAEAIGWVDDEPR